MSCQISLGPNDDLELITPSGRRLYVPISEHSTKFIWRILWDASAGKKSAGYVNGFPTQAVINQWLATEGKAKREAEAKKAAEKLRDKYGIDLKELNFDL